MQKIHITTHINASREKVWNTMLGDASYREWTKAFYPGSYYKGSWEEGSKILFLGPSPAGGGEGGMVSQIEKNVPHEFISIHHLGIVNNGVEITEGPDVEGWKDAHENYTFVDKDGGTEFTLDMDILESEKENMEESWKKALQKLKELSEK